MPAFRRAIEVGADYVEFDVQATRDGHLVVFHDPVRATLAGLRAVHPDVPTLDEALAECVGRVGLAVEIKSPYLHRRHRLTARTLAVLAEHGAKPDATIIVSFSRQAVLETRRLRPDLRTVQHVAGVPIRVAGRYAWGVGFEDRRATPRALALARRYGLATTVYTVNDPARMRELGALAVDGIFTDRPDVLRALLRPPAS